MSAFEDTHFQVDGVSYDVDFYGLEAVEEVTVVVVKVADGVFVGHGTLFQQFLVVDVTFLHAEHVVQLFGRIQRVTHPCDIAEVVFVSFFYSHEDVHRTVVVGLDAVFHDHSITVSQFVVFVDDQLLVCFEILFYELFGAEYVDQLVFLVGLLHDALQLLGCYGFITGDGDFVYLYFLFLVDVNAHDHLVLVGDIILLRDDYVSVLETFVVKVAFDQGLGTVDDVRGYLSSLDHSDSALYIFAFRFLHAMIADLGYTRALRQVDAQPYLVALYLICRDLDIGEQTVTPVALTSLGDLVARNSDGLTYRQTGQSDEYIVFVVLDSFYFNLRNFIFLGGS